jgi:hypothetical protein
MLEIYTLHAVRGIWKLGPYSQFGWNHPGPLYFYLLAPFYLLAGEKTIGLHAGAFAINLLSLFAIVFVLIRYAAPAVACAGVVAIGVYLFRLEPIISSYWNPHIVILPVAAFLVLCASLAAGRRGALPAIVLAGSFLAQTHVSLVPYVVVLAGGALAAAAFWRVPARASGAEATPERTHARSLGWWINLSAWLLLLLWLFPLVDQLSHTPGNLARMVRFFSEPADGKPLSLALVVWGDMMCALFRPHLVVPVGWPLKIDAGVIYIPTVCAIAQVLLLAAACWDAMRRQDRFDAALCAAGLLASVTGLLSITRIRSFVGDYMVFWMSAIGALNWAVIAGLALTRFVSIGIRLRETMRWATLGASAIVVGGCVYLGADQIEQARQDGLKRPRDSARTVMLLSDAIVADLRRRPAQRALIQLSTDAWSEAAGVVLQLYKRGVPLSTHANEVSFFGEPFAPNGHEDRVFIIADRRTHAELSGRPGDEVVAEVDGVYIHALPKAQQQQ